MAAFRGRLYSAKPKYHIATPFTGRGVDGGTLTTRSTKAKWQARMECVSGYFFSLFWADIAQSWGEIEVDLRRALHSAAGICEDFAQIWQNHRREANNQMSAHMKLHGRYRFREIPTGGLTPAYKHRG